MFRAASFHADAESIGHLGNDLNGEDFVQGRPQISAEIVRANHRRWGYYASEILDFNLEAASICSLPCPAQGDSMAPIRLWKVGGWAAGRMRRFSVIIEPTHTNCHPNCRPFWDWCVTLMTPTRLHYCTGTLSPKSTMQVATCYPLPLDLASFAPLWLTFP